MSDSAVDPLIRPSATFSPWEGAKGRGWRRWCILLAVFVGVVIVSGCGQEKAVHDVTIECRSPNGKRETKTLPKWKYDRVRDEILSVLPTGETGMAYSELKTRVEAKFSKPDAMHIGKIPWYIDTVVLEMETAEELVRFPKSEAPLPMNVKRE